MLGRADRVVNTPDNLLGATLQNLQCKFYAVGMMYSINARVSFQRDINDARSVSTLSLPLKLDRGS
jgi:hypothetical protein